MQVRFIKSGKEPKDYPFPYQPEVAIVGRSNAGKSSFLNALTGQKTAKVSGRPGHTRLLNFFEWGKDVYLVDLPGYGFATGDRREAAGWKQMIETYLSQRETLRGVLLIMDIRRSWTDSEEQLRLWLQARDLPWALILTKSDKLKRGPGLNRAKEISKAAGGPKIFVVSSLKRTGMEEVRNLIRKEWSV